jgi:hypothetical protein
MGREDKVRWEMDESLTETGVREAAKLLRA